MGRVYAKIQIRLKVLLLWMSLRIENQSVLSGSASNARQYVCLGLCGGYRREDGEGRGGRKGTTQVKFKGADSLSSVSSMSFPNKGPHLVYTHIPTEVSVLVSFLVPVPPPPHKPPPLPPLYPSAPLSLFWIK